MYKVAVMQSLQAACHVASNVQQNALLVDSIMISTMTAKV